MSKVPEEAGLTPTDIKQILAKMSRKITMGDAMEAIADAASEKAYQQGRADVVRWLKEHNLTKGHPNCFMLSLEDWQALQRGEEKG